MDGFYASLPTFTSFAGIVDAAAYRPLPDDWVIGIADVVASTEAVARGRYKSVNMAGAAVISAVSNLLGTLDFPYVFTGDGMVCAVAPVRAPALREVLGATLAWVGAALDLAMRATIVPVAAIRAAGHDVRVARYRASPGVTYAMFSGGGVAWAEAALKAGMLQPLPLVAGGRPDLSGLSCRFKPMASRKDTILSLIAAPRAGADPAAFPSLVNDLLTMIGEGGGNPVPDSGPAWGWPPDSLDLEARVQRRANQSLWASRLSVAAWTLMAAAVVWFGRRVGGFTPARYRREIAPNTDFRKFEDGLMMTLDCPLPLADAIEARLAGARSEGVVDFGVHRQDAALLTCVVPFPGQPGHVHFVDGAGGGYTMAARALKQSKAVAPSLQAPARMSSAASGAPL